MTLKPETKQLNEFLDKIYKPAGDFWTDHRSARVVTDYKTLFGSETVAQVRYRNADRDLVFCIRWEPGSEKMWGEIERRYKEMIGEVANENHTS